MAVVDRLQGLEFSSLIRAGTVGSLALCVCCTPLDVARHSAQAAFKAPIRGRTTGGRLLVGFPEALRVAAKPGMLTGLWRGLPTSLALAGLSPATFLIVYVQQKSYKDALEAGACARAAQTLILQPLDFMRTLRQAGACMEETPHIERGMWGIVKIDGPLSLWRGVIPTLLRDVPMSVGFWASYSALRGPLCGWMSDPIDGDGAPRASNTVVALKAAALGSVCAAAASFITHPFDVVKTRMQVHRLTHIDKDGYKKVTPVRVIKTFREAHAAAGVRGLFAGFAPRGIKAAIGGFFLGPFFEHCGLIADDALRPTRRIYVVPEDPTRTIVHPRAEKATYLEFKQGR